MFEDLTVLIKLNELESEIAKGQALIDEARVRFSTDQGCQLALDRAQTRIDEQRWRVETAKSLYVNPN